MFGHQQQDDHSKDADFNPALPPEMLNASEDSIVNAPLVNDVTAASPSTFTPTGNGAPVAAQPTEEPEGLLPSSTTTHAANDDLLTIKQQALKQLSPLVGHLEQSPEEKFRTTMMMIQASDDQSLITQAYEAAQSISDEKVRAQALLDVVNEINYFTQHQDA